jgi:hypothetical protein
MSKNGDSKEQDVNASEKVLEKSIASGKEKVIIDLDDETETGTNVKAIK